MRAPEEIETLGPDSENSSFAQRSLCDKLDYFAAPQMAKDQMEKCWLQNCATLITQPKSRKTCKFYFVGSNVVIQKSCNAGIFWLGI
jgi:hypothetical protein